MVMVTGILVQCNVPTGKAIIFIHLGTTVQESVMEDMLFKGMRVQLVTLDTYMQLVVQLELQEQLVQLELMEQTDPLLRVLMDKLEAVAV